jgi:PBP1b-binding outer membrane lipoprotein LpoB
MKKIILPLITAVVIAGCADNKAQEKATLDSVLAIHEKVMGTDEILLKNKMLLDSMVKKDTTTVLKDSVSRYLSEVINADSAMSTWMHHFDADMTGKLPAERMIYLRLQKKTITKVDSQINAAISSSDKYLKKMKMK